MQYLVLVLISWQGDGTVLVVREHNDHLQRVIRASATGRPEHTDLDSWTTGIRPMIS